MSTSIETSMLLGWSWGIKKTRKAERKAANRPSWNQINNHRPGLFFHTYKNEHGICQISPLDLPDVVVHCRAPCRCSIPISTFHSQGTLGEHQSCTVLHPTEQLTEQSDHDCSNLVLVFAESESAYMKVKFSVEPTDMTPVGGKKWHSDWL